MDLNPNNYSWVSNKTIYEWRKLLKEGLLKQNQYRSDLSGTYSLSLQMHEGIVTRACLPKSVKWHYMIYHEFNCFLLTPEEHIPLPPSREWCIQKAFEKYGEEAVREWFYNLPWKVIPFRI